MILQLCSRAKLVDSFFVRVGVFFWRSTDGAKDALTSTCTDEIIRMHFYVWSVGAMYMATGIGSVEPTRWRTPFLTYEYR